jgi:hypothetical protein
MDKNCRQIIILTLSLSMRMLSLAVRVAEDFLCSTQLPVHQRMNANGFLLPNDLFS